MKKIIAVLTILLACECALQAQTVIKGNVSIATGKDIVDNAMQFIGTPYRSGRMNPKYGFDCSGFTSYIYKMENIILPRSSHAQFQKETEINDSRDLKKGDLVFFSGSKVSKRIGHVGIVTNVNHETGEFSFIHSSNSQGVTISHSTEKYYSKRYIGACRILKEQEKASAEPYWIPFIEFVE